MKIEERAKRLVDNIIAFCLDFGSHNVLMSEMDEYVTKALTEQDRISRAEEREQCIKAAQDWNCKQCAIYELCYNSYGGSLDGKCKEIEEIREAIEKGGNNEND